MEAIITWLLEHEALSADLSDDDSSTSFEAYSDSDSFTCDDDADVDRYVRFQNFFITCM